MRPETMEKHQHNIAFEESYWEDALAVLKREERKLRLRRLAIFLPLGLVVFFGAMFFLLGSTSPLQRSVKTTDTFRPSSCVNAVQAESTNTPSEDMGTSSIERHDKIDGASMQANETAHIPHLEAKTSLGVHSNMEQKAKERSSNDKTLNNKGGALLTVDDDINLVVPNRPIIAGDASPTEKVAPSMLEISAPKTSSPEALRFQSVAMQQLGFSGIDQSGRPGLKHQLGKLNKRHEEFRKWSLQPQQWMLYAGLAFTKDYASLGGALAFNPQLGIAFEQHIAAKTYFRVGAGMQQISQVFASEEYREIQASFGYQYHNTKIATQRLYLLEVPLNLVYDFKLRHAVLAGVGLEYIGLTKNIVKTEVVNAFASEEISREDDLGYLTGYTPLFWNAQIGYRYRFTRRASFDVTFTSGFAKIHESLDEGNTRVNARFNFNLR